MAHVCTTGASAVTHKFLELECQERLTIIEGTNITHLSEGIPVALSKSILQFSLKSFSATKLACCKGDLRIYQDTEFTVQGPGSSMINSFNQILATNNGN